MISSTRSKAAKISAIALLVICITVLHYRTDHLHITVHILFREMYFLPIFLGGFWFGMYGGVGSSLFVTLLYLPYVLALPEGISGHNFGNVTQIIIFNIFGLFLGLLRERELRRQQQLRETESLAAMGKAISCIAHDMKTPLMAIGGLAQQVKRKIADDNLAGKLDFIFEQVQRLEALVGDMLAFAKPLDLQYQQGMINHLLEEIVMISGEKAAHHGVPIRTELQENMPVTEYDKNRLHQALLNLVNNALEASPKGSEVIIRNQHLGADIIVEIADSGSGIPNDLLDDIFTPFVTTKKEGTGLGLSITKKIMDAHGGSVHVTENSDKGVTFRITLPVKPIPRERASCDAFHS